MPLVSIVVPAFNSADVITEALDSILAQSYGNVEAVVVDDGSSDETVKLVEGYSSTGKVKCHRQENGGPGAARNTGIRVSEGKFVMFLDADDSLTADSIESRMGLIGEEQGLELVYSNYFIRRPNGSVDARFDGKYPGPRVCACRQLPHGKVFEGSPGDIFEFPFDFWTGAVLAGRNLLERTGPFRIDTWIGEDRDMWIRLSLNAGKIGYVGTPVAYYNRTKTGLTGRDAVRYFIARRDLNRGFLERYGKSIGGGKVRKVIHEKLSWVYFDLGNHYRRKGRPGKAIGNFLKSIYFSPANGLPYKSIARMAMPERFRNWVKQAVGTHD